MILAIFYRELNLIASNYLNNLLFLISNTFFAVFTVVFFNFDAAKSAQQFLFLSAILQTQGIYNILSKADIHEQIFSNYYITFADRLKFLICRYFLIYIINLIFLLPSISYITNHINLEFIINSALITLNIYSLLNILDKKNSYIQILIIPLLLPIFLSIGIEHSFLLNSACFCAGLATFFLSSISIED